MSFSIIMIIKKIFSVILRLSNNTKYLRPFVSNNERTCLKDMCVHWNMGKDNLH